MAYLRYSNFGDDQHLAHLKNQNTINRFIVRHSFSTEITTTPQSISALIQGQAANQNLHNLGLYAGRERVEFHNPQSVSGNPTIYIAVAPQNGVLYKLPPYVSTGVEISDWAIGANGYLEEKFGVMIDFLVWCSLGTAALVFKELG